MMLSITSEHRPKRCPRSDHHAAAGSMRWAALTASVVFDLLHVWIIPLGCWDT